MDNHSYEPRDVVIKRLRFRSNHRGWKETDLVLGQFANQQLDRLDASEIEAYAALLDENDADIWDWLVQKSPPPRGDYAPLLTRLRAYTPAA